MRELITVPRLLFDGVLVSDGWIEVDGGVILSAGRGTPPHSATTELGHGILSPGLIDAQCNGAFGHDLSTADADGWAELVRRMPSTGVTAFVPTLVTDEVAAMIAATERYHSARETALGARMLGLHYEGPFLSPQRPGAHPVEHLLPADDPAFELLLNAAGAELAYMTLAPEIPGGMNAVRHLVALGLRVAIGHSDATDDEAIAAIDAGASLVTHLYNAQRPLQHRDPGVVGAALSDPRVTIGLIADLHHVAPTALRVAFAAAAGRVMLVTDAVAAMGVEPGTWTLAGRQVDVRQGEPPRLEDGTIAGSSLRLDEAVANVVACGIDPAVALTAATRVPADALGFAHLGRIAPGCPADLVWLDDNFRTCATWIEGIRSTPEDSPSRRDPTPTADDPSVQTAT